MVVPFQTIVAEITPKPANGNGDAPKVEAKQNGNHEPEKQSEIKPVEKQPTATAPKEPKQSVTAKNDKAEKDKTHKSITEVLRDIYD